MSTSFGDFKPLCQNVPSYPWCNLFYRQVCTIYYIPCAILPITAPVPLSLRLIINIIFVSFLPQVQDTNKSVFNDVSLNPATAPVGVNPSCGIPFVGTNSSLGNIANIVVCGLSIIFTVFLIWGVSRRRAAVCESVVV